MFDSRALVLALALVLCLPLAAAADEVGLERVGLLSGSTTDDGKVAVYLGIPYAAPPVGELRWRPPQPAWSWKGVREAKEFGPKCPQRNPPSSENCLYLNVWAPAEESDDGHPVMVWIHGGGHSGGAASVPRYSGEAFARRGIVLVSINYRLGALGFLAHPLLSAESEHGVSGNYGILDSIMALEWVRDHIGVFGGDRDNVTIFGESAGGTSVAALSVSPLAKGLFHRAIAESPWFGSSNVKRLRSSVDGGFEAAGEDFARKLVGDGHEVTLAALRDIPAEDILAAEGFSVALAVDGRVFTDHPVDLYRQGRQHDVPLVIGTNADEGTMFARRLPFSTPEEYRAARKKEMGSHVDDFLTLYPARNEAEVTAAAAAWRGDSWFAAPVRTMVRGMDKVASHTWRYYFTRPNQKAPEMGANHALEIGYVFNTLEEGASESDLRLADAMIRYWVEFATASDPNVDGLPAWPAYATASDRHLVFDTEIRTDKGVRNETCDLIDRMELPNQQLAGP